MTYASSKNPSNLELQGGNLVEENLHANNTDSNSIHLVFGDASAPNIIENPTYSDEVGNAVVSGTHVNVVHGGAEVTSF